MQEGGKIKLIIGPMFSGKSTRLIETVRKYSYKNKKTVVIKFIGDKRYDENQIVTHDLVKYDSLVCLHLTEKKEILKEYDVIGIDEGQFFDDLVRICEELCFMGKIIIVAALSGDYLMKPFPNISELISKADKIKLMKAYCYYCHKIAGFTMRTVRSNKLILIGSAESYRPTCKFCYYKHSNNLPHFSENEKMEKDNNWNINNNNNNNLICNDINENQNIRSPSQYSNEKENEV